MRSLTRLQKMLLGAGACGGFAAYIAHQFSPQQQAHLSWTTNYTPSSCAKWDNNWDHRSPECLSKPLKKREITNDINNNLINESIEKNTPKAIRHIILIRHGQYNLNGQTDKERILTELGRKQAEWTGFRLKELKIPYTEIVRSTMTRAQETGDIISKCLPDIPTQDCSLLEEGAPVPPEPAVGHWKPEKHFFQDGARIEAAFRHYFYRADTSQEKDSYTILVCHANVIRYFICRALQFPAEAWLRISLNHASISWLSITPNGRVILRQLGDSGHMPPEGISRS